eukprot:TRINITY_DN27163_c1_g1_i1.p1 TRINITY_DN27163_c1_g1~~TRINITY_DN27163_c1_g1_i1.p1  ORF type:complete len:374 (-),score=54.18 TRINITY_DN27163_c1_g1_i1:406-1497(-)
MDLFHDGEGGLKPSMKEHRRVTPSTHEWTLCLHGAEMSRSFAKLGWMNPYAEVLLDGEKTYRTSTAWCAHKKPRWDFCAQIAPEALSGITIVLYTTNSFGKDVLCGTVTVPWPDDMREIKGKHFNLKKYSECTGSIHISLLQRPFVKAARQEGLSLKRRQIVPFDSLVPSSEQPQAVCADSNSAERTAYKPNPHAEPGMGGESLSVDKVNTRTTTQQQSVVHQLAGRWRCIDSECPEDFLRASGADFLEWSLVLNAKGRLTCEFSVGNDRIDFTARTATGVIFREILALDGSRYVEKDGCGNIFQCRASWENFEDGGILTTHRQGNTGSYIGVCRVAGDNLSFVLSIDPACSWGCTFRREHVN